MYIIGTFDENDLKELEIIYKTVMVENRIHEITKRI
jgi:hypothetical protein